MTQWSASICPSLGLLQCSLEQALTAGGVGAAAGAQCLCAELCFTGGCREMYYLQGEEGVASFRDSTRNVI